MPTPREIKASLDARAVGQDSAKERVAIAAWLHSLGNDAMPARGPQAVLLIGPRGSGKSALAAAAAAAIGAPFTRVSAPALVGSGYGGTDLGDVLGELRRDAGGDLSAAQRGVVEVSEVDQIRLLDLADPEHMARSAQHALLRLLRRGRINVSGEREPVGAAARVDLDTNNILVFLTGDFGRCEEHARVPEAEGVAPPDVLSCDAVLRAIDLAGLSQADGRRGRTEFADLVHWGLLPELVGGVTGIVPLRELQAVDFRALLEDPARSPVECFVHLFARWGVSLEVSWSAREGLAESACHGGRGLATINGALERLLRPCLMALPQLREQGVTHVAVTRESLRTGVAERRHGTPVLPLTRPRRPRRGKAGAADAPPDRKSWEYLASLKAERLDWAKTDPGVRAWWDAWEADNRGRLDVVVGLAESLAQRGVTVGLFYSAFRQARVNSIEGLLHYLDYMLIRDRVLTDGMDPPRAEQAPP